MCTMYIYLYLPLEQKCPFKKVLYNVPLRYVYPALFAFGLSIIDIIFLSIFFKVNCIDDLLMTVFFCPGIIARAKA